MSASTTAERSGERGSGLDDPLRHPGTVGVALALTVAALCATALVVGDAPVACALAIAAMTPAAIVDARSRRLPDGLVGGAAIVFVLASALALATASDADLTADLAGIALAALAGAVAMAGPLLVLHLVSPAALGFGDVKAAIVLGAALGQVGWELSLLALALAAGGGVAVGIVNGKRTVPFGPAMVVAAAAAIASPSWVFGGSFG